MIHEDQRYLLSVEMRHVLMMTAFPSDIRGSITKDLGGYTPQGILVSLKQADEALRKGRNT